MDWKLNELMTCKYSIIDQRQFEMKKSKKKFKKQSTKIWKIGKWYWKKNDGLILDFNNHGKVQQTSQIAKVKGVNSRQKQHQGSRHERTFKSTCRLLKRHAGWTDHQSLDGEQRGSNQMIWKRNNWSLVELWRGILQGKVHE